MLSRHFSPILKGGLKFDAGMILMEFDALREPERTRFPDIGEYLRGLFEFNEVLPKMLWKGEIHPDLYIANQLDAVAGMDFPAVDFIPNEIADKWKQNGPDDYNLNQASRIRHGDQFHDTFIEPMCAKILGIPTSEVVARYHRCAWLPLYWPQTLRNRESLPTRFWYPRKGYAGILAEHFGTGEAKNHQPVVSRVEIKLTFVVAKPTREFQTLFVVDPSPIYRITNQDACAGLNPKYQRFVIESREYCQDVTDEAQKLNLFSSVQYSSSLSAWIPTPTLGNVRLGWKPAPHLNDQLWSIMCSQ